MRTVVVGASSGLGRCIAVGLAKRGATVALLARREERLADAAAEAGEGAVAIACDVTNEAMCRAAIDQASDVMGGIDALVYAAGVGRLARMAHTDAEMWRRTFDTNVIGAATATAAALPHLTASHGAAAYLSSVSASMTPPWPGLGAYVVSKAALEKMIDAWRCEHSDVGFVRVVVGDCAGGEGDSTTQFADTWDQELAAEVMPIWVSRGYLAGCLVDVAELVQVFDTTLRLGATASIASVVVIPRPQN